MNSLLIDCQQGTTENALNEAFFKLLPSELSRAWHAQQITFEPAQSLTELVQNCHALTLPAPVKSRLTAILNRLRAANVKLTGSDLASANKVGFPNRDDLASIVGCIYCLDHLDVASTFCFPVGLSLGIATEASCSQLLPYPATLDLLASVLPVTLLKSAPAVKPLTAAFLSEVAQPAPASLAMNKITAIAYSDYSPPTRLVLGELITSIEGDRESFAREEMFEIECNLDDASPQAIAFATEELSVRGAADVFVTPCSMKKSRSGHLITVLCDHQHAPLIRNYLLANTSTLGLREHQITRHICERAWVDVVLPNAQTARVKIAKDKSGRVLHALPEYEDCARYARHVGKSFAQAHDEIMAELKLTNRSLTLP